MSIDKISYPEFIPEGCRECPVISPMIESWQFMQHVQDSTISSLTNDEKLEEMASQIPDETMEFLSLFGSDTTDKNSIQEKTEFIRRLNSDTFQGFSAAIQQLESEMQITINGCIDKKPTKVRIPQRNGNIILKACGSLLNSVRGQSDHTVPATIRRESPKS